jgi:hypothetical protein
LRHENYILADSGINRADITGVSNGSTDSTVEIASRREDQIRLIAFPKNGVVAQLLKKADCNPTPLCLGFSMSAGPASRSFLLRCAGNWRNRTPMSSRMPPERQQQDARDSPGHDVWQRLRLGPADKKHLPAAHPMKERERQA